MIIIKQNISNIIINLYCHLIRRLEVVILVNEEINVLFCTLEDNLVMAGIRLERDGNFRVNSLGHVLQLNI